MNTQKWIDKNTYSLLGKIVAISGSTGGLGKALCEHLARLGASLLLLDRNEDRALQLIHTLKTSYPDLCAEYIKLDLSDIDNVKSVTEKLCEQPPDFLVLNAGIYHVPRFECGCGYNNIFQVNFVSPYYMARRLKTYIQSRGGRIVAVSSIAHNYSKISTSDIDFSTYKQSSKVYGNSKRFLTFSLFSLFDGEGGMSVAHPGITFTNITSHYPKVIFALIKHPMKVVFMSPKKASLCVLRGLFDDCGKNQWIGPRIFDVWGLPKKKALKTCSPNEAKKINQIADDIYNRIK